MPNETGLREVGNKACVHCGPTCYQGAAHNARVEDGVLWKPQYDWIVAASSEGVKRPESYTHSFDSTVGCCVVHGLAISETEETELYLAPEADAYWDHLERENASLRSALTAQIKADEINYADSKVIREMEKDQS